jgi:uncharacterized protein YndB with AHSA1/START domain
MNPLHYEITIKANPETVWNIMLGKETYPKWTSIFKEGSYFEGDWSQGSEMLFLGPDDEGNIGGMASRIIENTPVQVLTIEHYGLVNNGVVDTKDESIKIWAPAYETYRFSHTDEGTDLRIEINMEESFDDYFNETWPLALAHLRDLCEAEVHKQQES